MKKAVLPPIFFLFILFFLSLFSFQHSLFAKENQNLPSFSLFIEGTHFSPNNDGIQDSLIFSFQIHLSLKSLNGYIPLLSVEVMNDQNEIVRSIVLKENQDLPKIKTFFFKRNEFTLHRDIIWDGKNNHGKLLPDGNYHIQVTLEDDNKNKSSQFFKDFIIDNTPPEVILFEKLYFSSENNGSFFSPNGDGKKDLWEISPKGSVEKIWTSRIVSESGTVLKSLTVSHSPPPPLTWDGIDTNGEAVPDGNYCYEIESTDEAGNKTHLIFDKIILDRTRPLVKGEFSSRSLLINSSTEKIFFTPQIEQTIPLVKWKMLLSKKGSDTPAFLSESNLSLPEKIVLNAKNFNLSEKYLEEGFYDFLLTLYFQNGSESSLSESLYFDTTPTFASVTMPSWEYFSPKTEMPYSILKIEQNGSKEDLWKLMIQNEKGEVVYQEVQQKTALHSFEWNGLNSEGAIAPNGIYSYLLQAQNPLGEIIFEKRFDSIKINQYDMGVSIQYPTLFFVPDNRMDSIVLQLKHQNPQHIIRWNYLFSQPKQEPFLAAQGTFSDLPQEISIPNRDSKKSPLTEGRYHFHYEVQYNNGEIKSFETDFFVDKSAGIIEIEKTVDPFQIDNSDSTSPKENFDKNYKTIVAHDSFGIQRWELTIKGEKGIDIRSFIGEGNPSFQIFWEDSPVSNLKENYRLELTVFDHANNESFLSEKIESAILILKKDERFYLIAPNILFAPYKNDLESAGEKQYQLASHSLHSVKTLLNRYPHYHLLIEGHELNPYTPKTKKWFLEEEKVLRVTQERTLSIQNYFIEKLKIAPQKIHTNAFGSQKPLYPSSDFKNNGKNRRIEFILIPQEKIKNYWSSNENN